MIYNLISFLLFMLSRASIVSVCESVSLCVYMSAKFFFLTTKQKLINLVGRCGNVSTRNN